MNINIVFQGNGILGIGYVGAVKALNENNYKIQRCAGTSSGSIIASLIAAGYDCRELDDIIRKTDFRIFMKKTKLSKIFLIGSILSIIFNKGIYDGDVIEDWIYNLLKKKHVTKFKDLMNADKSRLKIIASDITERRIMILPDDLKKYNIDPMDFSVAKAVRMSCSIPLYFTPYIIKNSSRCNFIVDGGLLDNFPTWIFDTDANSDCPTFGIKIKNTTGITFKGKKDILSYLIDIVSAPSSCDSGMFICNKDKMRNITLDYSDKISATDFSKSNELIDYLCNVGYNAACNFIEKLDPDKYI